MKQEFGSLRNNDDVKHSLFMMGKRGISVYKDFYLPAGAGGAGPLITVFKGNATVPQKG